MANTVNMWRKTFFLSPSLSVSARERRESGSFKPIKLLTNYHMLVNGLSLARSNSQRERERASFRIHLECLSLSLSLSFASRRTLEEEEGRRMKNLSLYVCEVRLLLRGWLMKYLKRHLLNG
jgi:hypothetical protein